MLFCQDCFLLVTCTDGITIPVAFDTNTSIRRIKERIITLRPEYAPIDGIKLAFHGRELDDTETVASSNIRPMSTLKLRLKPKVFLKKKRIVKQDDFHLSYQNIISRQANFILCKFL